MTDDLATDAVKPWRRLAASALDLLLLFPVHALLQSFFIQQQAFIALLVVASVAAVFSWRLFAATPGMALMDITLINARTGRRPGLQQLLRRLLGIILAALPLGIGLLWILKGPEHQGWQDRFSSTAIVTDDEARKSLAQLMEEAQ